MEDNSQAQQGSPQRFPQVGHEAQMRVVARREAHAPGPLHVVHKLHHRCSLGFRQLVRQLHGSGAEGQGTGKESDALLSSLGTAGAAAAQRRGEARMGADTQSELKCNGS